MTDKKISQLDPASLPTTGKELVAIVQSSETKKIKIEDLGLALKNDIKPKYPLYLDLSLHAKTNGFAESQKVITDVTRIDDYTLEVPAADIEDFDDADLFFPLVIKTPTNYIVVTGVVTDKPNGIISTRQILPAVIEEISTFFVDGQHLSRYGYRSLSEYIAEAIQKYSYRKDISFKVYTDNCKPFEQNWIDSTTDEVLVTVTKVPGTPSGGFLIPDELPYQCEMSPNASADQSGTFFKKAYNIYQNVVGYGAVFSGFTNDSEGFCKIVVGEFLPFNEGALKIECKDQDDNVFFTQNVTGTTQEVIVPLAYQTTDFTISFTVVTAVVTAWKISLIEIHRSYQSATDDIINKNSTVSFLCDSWGSFPQVTGGETLPLRADGTEADGMQFLSVHLKDYLLTKGINATTYNNSFGGRTSAWARYWLERLVLNLPKKPDFCVIDFLINDVNSESFAIANTDSVYDFSPTEPYTLQVKSLGGVKGSVTRDEWQENMSYIIQTLLDNDIQPIVLHNHRLDGQNFGIIEFNQLMINSNQGDLKSLVTFKDLDTKLPIETPETTGVALTFATDRVYGSIGTPETGNITADVTGAKLGVTNIIIHNSGTAPTFDSEFKKLSGSGSYVISVVNYIYCTYINATEIIYSINQRT